MELFTKSISYYLIILTERLLCTFISVVLPMSFAAEAQRAEGELQSLKSTLNVKSAVMISPV
jgi:hypothetical protein